MTDEMERLSALLAEADALIAVKRYQAAIERAQAAAAMAPQDPRPYYKWSNALFSDRQYAEAAVMADEAIRLAPDEPLGFRLRSMALRSVAGESSGAHRTAIGHEAVISAQEAVRLAPWDANGYIGLAQALPLTGAIQEAGEAIQEAIRLAPQSASTWAAASRVPLAAKNWNAAIEACHKALAIDPDNYAALNNLGVALRASGKKGAGSKALARAARAQPDAPTARRNLSRAGLNIVRVAIMLLLIPIGFVAHVGLGLYFVFAIGSNIALSKNPKLVLRLERWGAPIALFFANRREDEPSSMQSGSGRVQDGVPQTSFHSSDEEWPQLRVRHAIGTTVVLISAIVGWCMTLVLIVIVPISSQGRLWISLAALLFAGLAAWPTIVVVRRKRHEVAMGLERVRQS